MDMNCTNSFLWLMNFLLRKYSDWGVAVVQNLYIGVDFLMKLNNTVILSKQ